MERHRPLSGRASRRTFLSAALLGLTQKSEAAITGGFVNEDQLQGHRIRDRAVFSAPAQVVNIPLVIVGGGIAGLSAAWRLDKRGFHDFVLLEMNNQAGGNSRSGRNEVSAYPWAAHYVPVPNKNATLVREIFEEFGVLKDNKWDERTLCFAPQERLFLHGRWQEGLEPEIAATQKDRDQYKRFDQRIQEFRGTGQFTIPMESGARPSPLDEISMQEWLRANQFDSPYLNWYVNYACRDDYGALARDTSAWAGIHYFASREPDEKGPLAWPEGNGWIVARLLAKLNRYVQTGSMVYKVARERTRFRVLTERTEYRAEAVIFAAPTFLASHIIENPPPMKTIVYSPWLTANLTLDHLPRENGTELAWDNVIFQSPALGYVNDMHMTVKSRVDKAVWTYYYSMAEATPAVQRQRLLSQDWNSWKEFILNDLERAHPDLRSCVSHIDIMRIGHAMARPVPGFLGLKRGNPAAEHSTGNLFFAHADLSGFSIFEEAQYRGVVAADRALSRFGGKR